MNVTGLLEACAGHVVEDGDPPTLEVPPAQWLTAVAHARDQLGCGFFDFLTAVEEPEGVRIVVHVARQQPFGHLVLQTRLAEGSSGSLVTSVVSVFAGAEWCEREVAEMYGVSFLSEQGERLERPPLLLPPGFVGHPLRKSFWLEARQDRPWPGAKEPGESSADAASSGSRRRLTPPGVRGGAE